MTWAVLNGNWVDLVIILILLYYVLEAFRHGFFVILADFVSFLVSLLITFRAYKFVATFLRENFSLTHSIANALGFLATAIVIEAVIGYLLAHLVSKIPVKYLKSKLSKLASIVPSLGEGIIIVSFLLTLSVSLPIRPQIKADVVDSKIGGFILTKSSLVERKVNEVFGGVIEDSLTYLTIKPGTDETFPLTHEVGELEVDPESERGMFEMVNSERIKNGVSVLIWSDEIVPVARAHATDMWERKYFSHVSPDGEDVGDRLNESKVGYFLAGENLALAPTLSTAHTGLMNSEGHRQNILEPKFKKVGIGVIDNGVYGKMFVQVFTD